VYKSIKKATKGKNIRHSIQKVHDKQFTLSGVWDLCTTGQMEGIFQKKDKH